MNGVAFCCESSQRWKKFMSRRTPFVLGLFPWKTRRCDLLEASDWSPSRHVSGRVPRCQSINQIREPFARAQGSALKCIYAGTISFICIGRFDWFGDRDSSVGRFQTKSGCSAPVQMTNATDVGNEPYLYCLQVVVPGTLDMNSILKSTYLGDLINPTTACFSNSVNFLSSLPRHGKFGAKFPLVGITAAQLSSTLLLQLLL